MRISKKLEVFCHTLDFFPSEFRPSHRTKMALVCIHVPPISLLAAKPDWSPQAALSSPFRSWSEGEGNGFHPTWSLQGLVFKHPLHRLWYKLGDWKSSSGSEELFKGGRSWKVGEITMKQVRHDRCQGTVGLEAGALRHGNRLRDSWGSSPLPQMTSSPCLPPADYRLLNYLNPIAGYVTTQTSCLRWKKTAFCFVSENCIRQY